MTRTCAQNGLLAVRKRPAASYSSSMGPGLLVEFGYYPERKVIQIMKFPRGA